VRLDTFLKASRMVKRRSKAKELCQHGVVWVNGKVAKPSKEVKPGDIVEIDTVFRYIKFRILALPKAKNIPRKSALRFTEIIEDRKKNLREFLDVT